MDLDAFLRDPVSRRRFFRLSGVSVAGSSAVLLAACGGEEEPDQPTGGPGPRGDVAILNSALDLENMAVAAYAAGSRLLTGEMRSLGRQFLEQEREHAAGLTQAIKDMGGRPNRASADYDFPRLSSATDALRFAIDLENTFIGAYLDALPKLKNPKLRATAAAIVTNEAEHVAVLRGALGEEQVPSAFVTGQAA